MPNRPFDMFFHAFQLFTLYNDEGFARATDKKILDCFYTVKDEYLSKIRGATLIYELLRTLCQIPSYLRQLTHASRHGILKSNNV